MTRARLDDADLAAVDALVAPADAVLAARYPGDPTGRQPVHTVYVPAGEQVDDDITGRWGELALQAVTEYAGSPPAMAEATGLDAGAVASVWDAVLAKLGRQPVEDLRVDFEDGYDAPDDAREDADAVASGRALAAAVTRDDGPPFCGVRIKSFEAPTRRRGLRTLDLVLAAVLEAGPLPDGWVVTLPKVTSVEQVLGMVEACARLERAHGLEPGRLRFEVQVETAQAVLGADGTATVARLVHAGAGRVSALHYGTYDYSAGLGVPAAQQSLEHPAADHAKAVMQVAVAGTGVRLSDGSTNVLPVGPRDDVHVAWRLHARLVRRALERGYYQGWDLHPAQLPTRYLATYLFFTGGLPTVADRLRRYLDRRAGGILDEPATAAALGAFVLRGLRCGALDDAEVERRTGTDRTGLDALVQRRPPPAPGPSPAG